MCIIYNKMTTGYNRKSGKRQEVKQLGRKYMVSRPQVVVTYLFLPVFTVGLGAGVAGFGAGVLFFLFGAGVAWAS